MKNLEACQSQSACNNGFDDSTPLLIQKVNFINDEEFKSLRSTIKWIEEYLMKGTN